MSAWLCVLVSAWLFVLVPLCIFFLCLCIFVLCLRIFVLCFEYFCSLFCVCFFVRKYAYSVGKTQSKEPVVLTTWQTRKK